tara:strand:- start:147 stop:533 length:387 start_codon:yes stop_codon:yes gene_type:complete
MATLTPTLTLVSTDAFSHQPINISVTDSLSVVAPYTDLSRIAAATGGTIITAASGSPITYYYVKHTGALASNGNASTNLVTVADAGGATIATLGAGEFMFLPVAAGEGLKVTSADAAVFVEYIYFSKA